MKLFLILYTGAKIGGVWGPLPYDLAECERRAEPMKTDIVEVIRTGRSTNGNNLPVTPGEIAFLKTMRFACEFRDERPKLTSEE